MTKFMRFMLTVALLTVFVSPALADEKLSFKAGYFTLNPEGEIAVSGGGLTGTVVDVDDDLGIDDDGGFFAEAALLLGDFRLYAAYLPINFSGESILTQDVDFNGETFVIGSRVDSDVEIDIYEAGLAWFLVNLDDMPVRVQFGPEVAVKYVDARLEMRDDLLSLSEAESVGVAVPSVGARLRVGVADYLGVVGRIGYMEYNDNRFMDVDAQVEFSPLPLVGLYAGYRYLNIDVNESDVLIDATFSGPYAGAMVRF